jgi:hypothetical protein
MKTYGIRISDGKGDVLSVTLSDILKGIDRDPSFRWCILFLDGTPQPGKGQFLTEYENKINDSKNGLLISWEDLNDLSKKFFQMFEIIVLGCKDISLLHRYEEEKEMHKMCDIVIQLIDCAFWEVYTKEIKIVEKLKKTFKEVEFLDSNLNFST